MIPTCAQACVQSFIANDFPTSICPPAQGLDCLCTRTSKSGFTLGEGSLRCVVTTCSDVDGPQYQSEVSAYEICAGIPNARPMTHGTLTATKSSNPTISISTGAASSQRRSSSSSRHSHISALSSPSWTRSSTLVPNRTSDTTPTAPTMRSTGLATHRSATSRSSTSPPLLGSPSTTTHSSTITSRSLTSSSSASATPPPALPVAGPAPGLSKGKKAGIAIGVSLAALAFAGIVFFIYRYRQRHPNRRDSGSTFGPEGTNRSHPSSPALYHRIGGGFEQINRSRDFTQLESQDRPMASISANTVQPEIGVAVAPEMTPKPTVAESPRSSRTTSGLLPDKPTYSLYPAPLRFNNPVSPESPGGGVVPGAAGIGQRGATPLSKAAPRGRMSSDTSQVSLQRDWSNLHPSASDPFLDSRSRSSLATYARQRSQNPYSEVLTYGRPDPEVLDRGQWTQSMDNLRKPVPARQSSSARSLTRQQAAKASISPSDYTGRPIFDFPPREPITTQPIAIPRKPVPRRKSAPRRSAYSSASETSFEDAGDEEPIPTGNPILSPVAESPATRSDRRQITSPSQRRAEPESPTRRPTRRRQPPTLGTSAAAPRPLKSSLKLLPEVPENSDSSAPLIPRRRSNQGPPPIVTDARGSPRGETGTAKWKILVSPGLQPIENSGTPRSRRSSEWTPNTPTRRDV